MPIRKSQNDLHFVAQGFVNSGYGANGLAHVSSKVLSKNKKKKTGCRNIAQHIDLYRIRYRLQNAGPTPSPMGQIPPNEMSSGPMPPAFYHPVRPPAISYSRYAKIRY